MTLLDTINQFMLYLRSIYNVAKMSFLLKYWKTLKFGSGYQFHVYKLIIIYDRQLSKYPA